MEYVIKTGITEERIAVTSFNVQEERKNKAVETKKK